jgi:uncharacterized protein (DUF433 family)
MSYIIIVDNHLDRQNTFPGTAGAKVFQEIPNYVTLPTVFSAGEGAQAFSATLQYRSPEQPPAEPELVIDPAVRGGVPTVGSGRWPIAHILERLAMGHEISEILQSDTDLTIFDIRFALEVAVWVMRDPGIDWLSLDLPGMLALNREMQGWQRSSNEEMNGVDLQAED